MAGKTLTERHVLYGGSVQIDFYPNSHQYKLVKLDGVEMKKSLKSPSGIVGKLDKSQPLMSWATRMFFERMVELMGDGRNFTKDDLDSMLAVAKGAYNEKKKEAANVGTIVHYYAQHHHEIDSVEKAEGFAELDAPDQERARKGAAAFDAWYSQLGGKSVKSEFLVYSKSQGFVGTCDDLVEIAKELWILDYKTSKGVYTDQIYQVSGYMKAYEEENPDKKVAGARLVHLCKEDVLDKEGNVKMRAGDYGEVWLTRADLVQAYMVFKALKVVADKDPIIEKLLIKH